MSQSRESDSDRITIRPAMLADAGAIADIYNEAILTTTATFDLEPKTMADRRHWLKARTERHPVIVAEAGGAVVGFASLTPWSERAAYADTAETAMYVHSSHRNRGIGRMLKGRLIEKARRLGFHTLIARVTAESDSSIHLNEAFGFEPIGTMKEVGLKFGRRLDVMVYQKMLD